MNYNLMVFELSAALRTKRKFGKWYEAQTKWEEGHGYNSPTVSSPALQGWFAEIIRSFPPMNGPLALSNEDFEKLISQEEALVTDYSVGTSVIYAAFAWSVAEKEEKIVRETARKHKIGFFNPTSGEIVFHGDKG